MNPDLIFHEFYGVYFKAVEQIINVAQNKNITLKEAEKIVKEMAYAESPWLLIRNIQRNFYAPAIDNQLTTRLRHTVNTPLTLLERRWIKAILCDRRVNLFDINTNAFDDVEPLFDDSVFYCCGQYSNGDDYTSQEYIDKFHTILQALRESFILRIEYRPAPNKLIKGCVEPLELQYSIKEDLFRLIAIYNGELCPFNLSRICKIFQGGGESELTTSCPRIGFISDLVVTKTERGHGIGKALIAAAENYFIQNGCEYMQLEVFAPNVSALELYKKLGFRVNCYYMSKNTKEA